MQRSENSLYDNFSEWASDDIFPFRDTVHTPDIGAAAPQLPAADIFFMTAASHRLFSASQLPDF